MASPSFSPSLAVLSEPADGGYRWLLTEQERQHIGTLLNTDASAITLRGNVMNRDRDVCKCCGKHSGLDDLVGNALSLNIHNSDFMLDVLQHGPQKGSPAHEIRCSGCGEMFQGSYGWAPRASWVSN